MLNEKLIKCYNSLDIVSILSVFGDRMLRYSFGRYINYTKKKTCTFIKFKTVYKYY